MKQCPKTQIETYHRGWSPAVGCTNGCPYCYASKLVKRFPPLGSDGDFTAIRLFPERLSQPDDTPDGSDIFVCPLSDLWCEGFPGAFRLKIFEVICRNPGKRFFVQTKGLTRIGLSDRHSLSPNCWLGTTITGYNNSANVVALQQIAVSLPENNFYVSIEPCYQDVFAAPPPFREWDIFWNRVCSWIIVGPQTNPVRQPPMEAIKHIRAVARENDIPLWEKSALTTPDGKHIQQKPLKTGEVNAEET